jgi:type I restriction-modification system DNA methylase subunit
MDASQYKDYILTLLFVKYVSDKAKTDRNSLIEVPVGGSFDDMVALKGDKEIGDKINKIIASNTIAVTVLYPSGRLFRNSGGSHRVRHSMSNTARPEGLLNARLCRC